MTKHQHIIACALLLGAAACSNAPAEGSAKDAATRGAAALAQGQPRVARVELMNAIKADPDNGALRILQAQTYLALNDGVAAEAEIARARKLGIEPAETAHLMAHALLLRDEPQRALDELKSAPPAQKVYAARIRGQALAKLGDDSGAAAAFNEAIAAAPRDDAAWIDIGRFRRASGDLAGAVIAVDKAVALDPKNIEALTLRGEITRSQYGLRAALPWFDRALQIDPNNVPALLERAATLGDLGQTKEMVATTRRVLKLSENNPMALYLQAMVAARAKNYELARALYQRTGGVLDDQPSGMLLASAIDYQTGNVGQAAKRLAKLIALQPNNRKARQMLAAAQFKLGDNAATIATLRPLADRSDADSYTLALIGKAMEKRGDGDGAARYLARAAQPQRRTSTALWSQPVSDQQLTALRRFAAAKPGHAPSEVLLIGGLLSRGLGQEALERAVKLQAANPGAPDAHILVGDARGMSGDFRGAAVEYRKAANLAFSEPVAMRMIEALDRSGQGPAAAQVLQLFLRENPRSVSAQLLYATHLLQAKQWAGAIKTYEGLRERLGDRDAVMLNNLAWAYSEQGDYARALPLAQKAWNLDKDNPATTDTYGWLLFKSGKDKTQGLVLLERASRKAPADGQIRQHLAQARQG
jgi:tetratricopeptide (TPR) repeat protein